MTNDDYERIIRSEIDGVLSSAEYLKLHKDSSKSALNHHVWLRLLGLMETWDMRKHRLK